MHRLLATLQTKNINAFYQFDTLSAITAPIKCSLSIDIKHTYLCHIDCRQTPPNPSEMLTDLSNKFVYNQSFFWHNLPKPDHICDILTNIIIIVKHFKQFLLFYDFYLFLNKIRQVVSNLYVSYFKILTHQKAFFKPN